MLRTNGGGVFKVLAFSTCKSKRLSIVTNSTGGDSAAAADDDTTSGSRPIYRYIHTASAGILSAATHYLRVVYATTTKREQNGNNSMIDWKFPKFS